MEQKSPAGRKDNVSDTEEMRVGCVCSVNQNSANAKVRPNPCSCSCSGGTVNNAYNFRAAKK